LSLELLRTTHMVFSWTLLMAPILKWWIKEVKGNRK